MKNWQNKKTSVIHDDLTNANESIHSNEVNPVKNSEQRNQYNDNTPGILIVIANKQLRENLEKSLSNHFRILLPENLTQITKTCIYQKPKVVIVDEIANSVGGYNICSQINTNTETEDIPIILLVKLDDKKNIISHAKSGASLVLDQNVNPNMIIINIKILMNNIAELEKYTKKILAEKFPSIMPSTEEKNENELSFTERINALLEKNLTSRYTVTMLSKDMGMSRSSLYLKIEQITKISPKQYMDSLKLSKSIPMLISQKYTIAEISDYLGYCDSKYFGKKFKAAYQVSPKKYLESIMKKDKR